MAAFSASDDDTDADANAGVDPFPFIAADAADVTHILAAVKRSLDLKPVLHVLRELQTTSPFCTP